MADIAFAPQHNMIAYLEKTESNAEFHWIVDFLASSSIHHSLTVSPTIYASNIERFWNTATSQTINDEKHIHAIVDGKTIVITNTSARIDLLLTDANGSGPEGQDTIRGVMAQIRSKGALIQSIDPPLLIGGHTPGSNKGSMTLKELTDFCTTLLQKVLDLENVKTAQAKEIANLKKRVTKLEQRQSLRISGFHSFRVDKDADTKMIVEDKAKMYDEVQAQIDVDHELAVRLTHKEQEKYTVEERSKLLVEFFERRKKQLAKERAEAIRRKPSFEEIHKLYIKEQKWVDAFVPIGSEEDETRIGSRKKRAAGSTSKHKSPKKQKVNDQEFKKSDKEHRKCLKVVLDDDKAIDYETLDVKSLIVDCESQVLGTNEAGDVHVYKLTRLDGSYRHFLTFSRMLKVLDRQDVLDLHKIIMERFPANDSEGYDLILWGDLKILVKSNYKEINGGYVAFGGNPKGKKITRKCTIKTGNLDFENVYFERELKFNLFSVSQMCDKKNSVLFNDTECIVLSSNFKLIDESQVLIGVPRKNNMYSVDLKNIIPKGDHLGKFDGKVDEGFFVGYSLNSKAFSVFKSRTRIVEENLHIRFSESTQNVVGSGLNWLFDIDALTRPMNYEPIIACTQSNGFAGTRASDNASQAKKETEPIKNYILLPLWTVDLPFS
nr:putative ribonuclease H-like domain-containing protein [Tanacetum cinerariifolium]